MQHDAFHHTMALRAVALERTQTNYISCPDIVQA